MTQEEKNFLLHDLCARLPYGVIFNYGDNEGCDYRFEIISNKLLGINEHSITINDAFPIEDCKPYLRPMSSMTEEEKIEYNIIKCSICPTDDEDYAGLIDWLNSHHFDFRNLIDKRLAIDCTNLNIY